MTHYTSFTTSATPQDLLNATGLDGFTRFLGQILTTGHWLVGKSIKSKYKVEND